MAQPYLAALDALPAVLFVIRSAPMDTSDDVDVVIHKEDDAILQLLRQLEMCKRTILDCCTSLLEMTPLAHQLCPPTPQKESDPPSSTLPPDTSSPSDGHTTLSTFLALERELKESQEACREVELIAEDRENRLVRLESSLADSMSRLTLCEKEYEAMKTKYEFQVEVSQRVARHYHILQKSTSTFQSLYQELHSSLEHSRTLFEQYEHRIKYLQSLQAKMSDAMVKRREMAESREISLHTLEKSSAELQSKLNSVQLHNNDLQAQLDAKSATLSLLQSQLTEKTTENAKLLENAKLQASLIQQEHKSVETLTKQLESTYSVRTKNTGESDEASTELDEQDSVDNRIVTLTSTISLLELQVEELSQRRAEMSAQHNEAVDSLIRERNSANEMIGQLETQLEAANKEISDLRTLIAPKRRSSGPGSGNARSGAATNLANTTQVSTHRGHGAPSAKSASPFPYSSRTAHMGIQQQSHWTNSTHSSSQARSSIQRPTQPSNQAQNSPLNDSVMDVDSEEEEGRQRNNARSDPLRPLSPFNPPTRSLDLLGGTGDMEDNFGYRGGLKCCGEPVNGMTVSCSNCQDMFHVKCVEAMRGKSIPKNKRYLCYVCEPTSKATKKTSAPRRASLHLQE